MKKLLLQVGYRSGIFALCRRQTAAATRILTWHGIQDEPDPLLNFDGLQVSPERFRAQLEAVGRHFRVLPLRELVNALVEGRPWPERAAVITFDDGYQNNARVAAPILREFGFPATFFLATGFLDGRVSPWWYRLRSAVRTSTCPDIDVRELGRLSLAGEGQRRRALLQLEPFLIARTHEDRENRLDEIFRTLEVSGPPCPYPIMTWDEARTLAAQGFEIGPHTVRHVSLRHEAREVALREMTDSTRRVATQTGASACCLAYPYGLRPADAALPAQALGAVGIASAVTTGMGFVRAGDEAYGLRRLDITQARDPVNLASLLSGFTLAVSALKQSISRN